MKTFSPYTQHIYQQHPPQQLLQTIQIKPMQVQPHYPLPSPTDKQFIQSDRPNAQHDNPQASLDATFKSLVDENRQLNLLLNQNAKELDQLRTSNMKMEAELSKLRGLEHELLIIKELAELRYKESEKYRSKANQLTQEQSESEQDRQECKSKLKVYQNEITQWKSRYTELDSIRLKQLEETRYTMEMSKNELFEELKAKHQQQLEQLENNLEILSNQFSEQTQQLRNVEEELNQWKIKYSKMQVNQKQQIRSSLDVQELPKDGDQIGMLIEEIERLNKLLNSRNEEINQQRRLLDSATDYMPQLQEENKRLRNQVGIISKELEQLKLISKNR